MHFAAQGGKPVGGPNTLPGGPSTYPSVVEMNDPTANNNYSDPTQPTPNEFRARFHRSLAAPSPFRTFTDAQTTATTSTPTSSGGSGPPSDPIDPNLTGVAASGAVNKNGVGVAAGTGVGTSESRKTHASSNLDPDLGQARGGAEGVVDRLERGLLK